MFLSFTANKLKITIFSIIECWIVELNNICQVNNTSIVLLTFPVSQVIFDSVEESLLHVPAVDGVLLEGKFLQSKQCLNIIAGLAIIVGPGVVFWFEFLLCALVIRSACCRVKHHKGSNRRNMETLYNGGALESEKLISIIYNLPITPASASFRTDTSKRKSATQCSCMQKRCCTV